MGETVRHRAYVDRVEGELAVLLLGERGEMQATLPAAALPPGTGEGAALWLTLERDDTEERRLHDEIRSLMEGMDG